MKNSTLLLASFILGLLSSCTKENPQIEKPFSIDGTWEVKSMYSDSLGNLFFNHFGSEITKITDDSIVTKTEMGSIKMGHCKFNYKDTSINYSPWPNINYGMEGNKFSIKYTKALTYNEKGEPMLRDFDAYGKSVITIANYDSLFCYSTCCNMIYVMIRK